MSGWSSAMAVGRVGVFLAVAALTACTRPNPNVCCVTEAQCADLGADELRPCGVGQACTDDHKCVAAECDTSVDCPSDAPICRLGLCDATCTSEQDCADVVGRTHCAPDGACVACFESAQCTGTTNICDMEDRTCRGCERDDECQSGVCLEADGVCAEEADVIYVSPANGTNDTCTRNAPCVSLDYAFTKVHVGGPNVIHIDGGNAYMTAPHVLGGEFVVVDGTNTSIELPATTAFDYSFPAPVTLMNVRFVAGSVGVLSVPAGGTLRLYNVDGTFDVDGAMRSTGGAIEVIASRLSGNNYELTCSTLGRIVITLSELTALNVKTNTCTLSMSRNRFTSSDSDMIDSSGGVVSVENNLLVQTSEFSDSVRILSAPGSTFRFNTLVNTASSEFSGIAITGDGSVAVTSNIFAYNSTNPIGGGIVATDCLFDMPGATDAGANRVAARSTIFADLGAGDFHLAADSPAKEGGAPDLVTVDLDGNPRPAPVGSRPDIGAYEAP